MPLKIYMEPNVSGYLVAEGVKVPVPFKCQRCLVNDACYARHGQWRCTSCWQLEAAQEV